MTVPIIPKKKPTQLILTPNSEKIDILLFNPRLKFNDLEGTVTVFNLKFDKDDENLSSEEIITIVLYSDIADKMAFLKHCQIGYIDDTTLGIVYKTREMVDMANYEEKYKDLEPYFRKAKIDSVLD